MEKSVMNLQKPERLISRDFILIMAASLGTSMCNFIFFTALPLYARKVTGSDVYGGLMITFYSVAALVSRPITGIISDKYGRVKLLIIGAAVCAVACALYGVTSAVILLLGIRVINGLGFGMHSTCAGAVAADVLPKSRMAEGIGYFSLYSTISTAFGPFIALAVIGKGDIRDFRFLFFFCAGLCLMSTLCNCFITYERKRKKAACESARASEPETPVIPAETEQPAALPKTFLGFEYAVFLPMAVLLFMFFGQTSINTFLALIAVQRGFGNIGLFFTINAAGLFISRFLYAKLMDKMGPDVLVIPGILGLIVCIFLIPFVHTAGLLFVLAVPMGFASGAVYPSINTILFLRCSAKRRGTASAAYFASIDLGFAIGGIVLGIVAAALGYNAVYFIAAALTAIGLVLYLVTIAGKRPAGARVV